MQFLAARSLWTNLLAFRYDMPSAISPAIWIIFLSGGRTWLVEFCGRARVKSTNKHCYRSLVIDQHYKVRSLCCVWKFARACGTEKQAVCLTIHSITPCGQDEKLLTSLRRERRWLLRSPRVISSIITKVGCPWETTPSSRTYTNCNIAEVRWDDSNAVFQNQTAHWN